VESAPRAYRLKASNAAPPSSTFAGAIPSFVGITISLWPMIVPRHYTLWQAASAPGIVPLNVEIGEAALLALSR
jgi:cytochrome bd-type quinol oxidase subunit 2